MQLCFEKENICKLLEARNGDSLMLYLSLSMGETPESAAQKLGFSSSRLACAQGLLQHLGIWQTPSPCSQDAPRCTEAELMRRLREERSDFKTLLGEVQRRFGRTLSTEETLCLLNITDHIGLPTEVAGMLLSFCIERDRQRGITRAPSMRSIEKEAYRWADEDIRSLETAAAFMQEHLQRYGLLKKIAATLQIEGRRLTSSEEGYILSWLTLGFTEKEIRLAYEKTMANLNQFKWSYCGTILKNWHNAGLLRAADIKKADNKAAPAKRNSQYQKHGIVSESGKAAILQLLAQEGQDGIQ